MKRSDKAIAQLRWAKAKYHREARVWDEQMAEVTQRVSQLEQENQILEENVAHSSYHATLLEQANENMIEKNDNQRATITDLQHRLNDSLMEWQIVTAERETLAKDNAQLRAKLTDQNKVIDHLYEKNDKLVTACDSQDDKISEFDARITAYKERIASFDTMTMKQRERIAFLEGELDGLEEELKRQATKLVKSSLRTMAHDIIEVMDQYGAVPEQGWGDDDQLEYLEQLLDTYRTNTDDLASTLDSIRTQR